jgi:hypothetical protein
VGPDEPLDRGEVAGSDEVHPKQRIPGVEQVEMAIDEPWHHQATVEVVDLRSGTGGCAHAVLVADRHESAVEDRECLGPGSIRVGGEDGPSDEGGWLLRHVPILPGYIRP